MLGFFGRLNYRAQCTDVIVDLTNVSKNEASKFVEWYKEYINYGKQKGVTPGNSVTATCLALLSKSERIEKPEHFIIITEIAKAMISLNPESETARKFISEFEKINNQLGSDPEIKELQDFGLFSSEGFQVGSKFANFHDWYACFLSEVKRINPENTADGLHIVELLDDEPLKRAFKDKQDPKIIARAFVENFDIAKAGF